MFYFNKIRSVVIKGMSNITQVVHDSLQDVTFKFDEISDELSLYLNPR